MSILSALDELEKVEKVKQTVINTPKPKSSQPKIVQPIQPQLTAKQIADLQKMKQTKQADIEKKAKKDKADKLYKSGTPKVPYGTKGNLKDSKGKNLPRVVNPVAAGITKVASFGTSSLLPGMKEAEAQAQKQFPKSYIAGQVLGYAAPTGLATGLTKGLVKGATKKIGSDIGKRVVEGAIVGTTAEGTQIVKPLITKEITPEQAGKQLATGLVAGAGLDIGLGILGKVFKSLPKATATKIKSGATLSNAEKLNIVKELGLPEGTTADDYIRQMQDLAKSEDIVNIPKQREADQVEQYYKSLEKEVPTQQQIVKPIIAQEQSLVKPITQATERPTTIVKPLIEPTIAPQIKTPEIEPQGVKNIAESMNVTKTEKTSIRMDDADNVNFRKTIKNSLMKSELPEDLKDAYVKNPSVYEKSNNEDDWAKAWQKVSDNYEGSKSTLRSKDALEGADDTMEYIALLHKAAKGDISEAKQLADEFAEKGTNAGKAIQAIVALQKTTPEGQLVRATQTIREVENNIIENNPTLGKQYKAAKKEIEKAIKENAPLTEVENLAQKYKVKLKASEEKTYENLLNALAKKYKVPTLTDAEAKQIVDLMEQANKVDGREQEILFAKVDQMIADKVPASMGDKVRALRNLSLLGNIKTIGIRNPLGNLIFTGLENVSQIPSGITDKMVSKLLKTQRTTKVLPSLTTQAKGFKKGVQESWEDVINNVDTSPTRGGAELPRNRKIFETAWLNKANNWMGDALKFGDRPFYQAAYESRLKELMEIEPDMDPDEMKKLANQFGLERTFQNSSTTSKAAGMIKKGFNLGKDFGLGDIVMPYTQTPANILEKGVQYTPLNIINILGKVAGQAAGKETIRNNQKAFVDAVGRTFTGTGAIALGYKLAKDGYISGTQKGDSSKEKAIKKQAGEQQYSIKIGDKWYSFDWAQPASIPLAVGADMYLAGEDEETLLGKLQAGAISGMDTVFNQSMMQGVSRMFGGQSVSTGIVESIASAPSQFVPTLSGQAAQQKDPYKRDVDYSNIPEQIKTSAMKKIPGLREQLPETIDLFGEKTLEQGGRQGITKALSIFLSPTNISSETTDKITKDIYNLYKRTGETDVIPSKIPTGLSKEQEREFKITFGKDVKSSLEKLMSGSFDSLPDDRKVKLIKNAIDDAYSRSKDKLGIGKK